MITHNGCVISNERLNRPNNLVYRRDEEVEENVAELGVEVGNNVQPLRIIVEITHKSYALI